MVFDDIDLDRHTPWPQTNIDTVGEPKFAIFCISTRNIVLFKGKSLNLGIRLG
jgi:hypothetical protein